MQKYHLLYDDFGNTTSIGLGGWNATEQLTLAEYVYASKNGLLTKQTYGNGDNVSFTYDILGRTKTATYKDKDGDTDRVLTYVYTGDGQLYSIHDSSTGYTYLYTYDNIGRLIASCVKLNTTVLMSTRQEYSANNQLIAQHWTVGGTTYSETYTYSITDGSLTSGTNAVGQTLTYNYDTLRRLSSVTGGLYERKYTYKDISNDNTTPLVSGYHYKDTDGEVVYSFGYTYDVLGNIASHTDASGTQVYTYDAQNQLTRVRKSGTTLYEYTYDNAGNILTASNGTVTHTYTYGNTVWKDLLTAFDGQNITYDGSGNPLSYYNGTRWEFEWEEGRNLVSAAAGSNTYEYAYDSNGLRVSKEENGKTHTYLYASGKLLRETISVDGTVTDTLDFFYDHNGYPYEVNHTTGGTTTTYYYITNLQGDVLCMITGNGVSVASYSYDPYGKVLSATGTMASINPLRYRGYYYDTETGFYYLQSRYYDPSISRFVNADALVSTGHGIIGNNMFAYCNNNPIYFTDSSGCRPLSQFAYKCIDEGASYAPNTDFLMAFYGVDSPSEIPEMPEGAMIFVENITSVSVFMGAGFVEGRTIVMDANKYCEYVFFGIGWSESRSMPFDRTITQGYVYGIEDVNDYCGLFLGGSGNMLSTAFGGAYSSPEVYAEIVSGMSYAPSVGVSVTWYMTGQSDWIYGPANMVVVTNPYQHSPLYPSGNIHM